VRRRLGLLIKSGKARSYLPVTPMAGRVGVWLIQRELVISGTPFLVAYQIEKNDVRILAVLHAAGNGRRDLSRSRLLVTLLEIWRVSRRFFPALEFERQMSVDEGCAAVGSINWR